MRILAVNFKNNYQVNKTSVFQTQPITLKADSVQLDKKIAFKGELKTEEEILEFNKIAQKASLDALKEVSRIQEDVVKELKKANEIKKQIADMSLVLFRNDELIIGHNSIKYRTREIEDGPYDEYEFDMDAKIKTISKGVQNTDKMGQEIVERYTFDENQKLKTVECYFKRVPVRKVMKGFSSNWVGGYVYWNTRYGFLNGELDSVCNMTTYNVSGRYRTKEYLSYENGKLVEYSEDRITGNFGYKYAQSIKYGQEDGSFEYKKGFSNTTKGIEVEQTSLFKDGKILEDKEGGQ